MLDRMLYYGLHPTLILVVVGTWYFNRDWGDAYLLMLLGVQLTLGVLEYLRPARPHWRQSAGEKFRNVCIWAVSSACAVFFGTWYAQNLAAPLTDLRIALHMDIWPHDWPILVQLVMVFLLSEFIWYWMHRAEHRWRWMWRVTGHGAHHSFKRLEAINFGANHPFEMLFIVLPTALVELFFGVGIAAAGVAMLTLVQVGVAHANIKMNSKVIGWVLTTNDYHVRHHSAVLEESNTNYGCSIILWDRVFGTFADSYVVEAGTGLTEPTTWRKFLMPFKEPEDSAVAPGR
ncbi:MAG: sterol desaturase family protein [Pseudomonadota bacterium]